MIKKIFKWTGGILLLLIICISAITPLRQNLRYDAAFPALSASKDSAIINRGRELVQGPAHCVYCHSTSNVDSLLALNAEVPLSGGVRFGLPVGDIFSKNITPDTLTGIGKLTDPELARILRYGVHADGTAVYDFMPFHDMVDEDLVSVISYLRSLKPVVNRVPQDKLNVAGNLVKAYMVKPVGPRSEVPKTIKRDTSAAYGEYLAVSVADCNGCHTKRDISGKHTGEPFGGGGPMKEKDGTYIPPNLTPHFTGRTWQWSQEDFITRFRNGKILQGSPMPWNSFKRMSDDQLKAIYNYLRTIKPVNNNSAVTFIPGSKKN